jgi:nicotinate-nucleotide adenylyltransferase
MAAHPPPAAPGQRIGLLGGSFNPPHAAHLLISRIALTRLRLDRVWWLVSPGNPLKSTDELAPLPDRLQAARALADNPRIVVTGFEAGLGTRYTVETIGFLKARYPAVRFVWVMGADNLATFDRWREWRRIFAEVPVAVVDRPGWRLKGMASKAARALQAAYVPEQHAATLASLEPPAWTLLTGRLSPLSSTALRARAPRVS